MQRSVLRQEREHRPVLFAFVRSHPDKVTLNRAPRILKHAAKFPAAVQDEEVDVELRRRTLVVSDLAGAVSVDNGLPFIDCRDDGTVETLGSATVEKTIRIAGGVMRSFLGKFCCSTMLAISVGGFGVSLQAQETKMTYAANIPLVHMPGTPECFVMAAQQGDPGKEASILKMRGSAGCSVPWHWHPSTENIMMVSGTARTAIKDDKPVELKAGSFLSVPPKHVMNVRRQNL